MNFQKKYYFLFILIALVWQCTTSKTLSFEKLPMGQWNSLTAVDGSQPEERHEAAFVRVKDRFYLLGGRGMKPVSIYDTKTKKWRNGAVPPIELHHFQPIVYQKEIYVLGALTGGYPGETPVTNIYIYNPSKDNWRKGAIIPENRRRGGSGVALLGNKIFLVCGIKDGHRGDHKNWLDAFDLQTQQWEILPDAPRPRDHFQSVIVDNKLYNLGGRTTIAADNPFKNTIGEVDVFDLKTNKWTTLAKPLPTLRAGNFTLVLNNEILVLGGESFTQEPAHAEVEALHTHTHTWRSLPALPQGRHGTGAVFMDNQIFTASGCGNRGGSPELADFWTYSIK